MRHLIVGNGVAGTTAAQQIRQMDPDCEITMLTEEAHPFYSRIRLIDFLADEATEDDVIMHKPVWYDEHRIRLVLARRVASIDTDAREVVTDSGEKYGYDRLLLATGSHSFVPPIPGHRLRGVFTLRTLEDAKAIKEYARSINEVLLVGGGVLGLEAGNSLRKTGKKVSVVEVFPRLLPRQMDPQGSRILCAQMQEMGFTFYLGMKTDELIGRESVKRALLEDGSEVPAELAIISAGVRANTTLAAEADIACGQAGIIVDDRMRTSRADVYAAGDSAEHRGRMYGIWPAAEAEGRVAGTNMAGGDEKFEGITPSNVLKVAGIELAAAGDIDPEGRCQRIIKQDDARHIYLKLVHENGTLRGCIILGTRKNRGKILKAVAEGRHPEEVKGLLDEV
jgi:nitrite reductase (NADH) large subunit